MTPVAGPRIPNGRNDFADFPGKSYGPGGPKKQKRSPAGTGMKI